MEVYKKNKCNEKQIKPK